MTRPDARATVHLDLQPVTVAHQNQTLRGWRLDPAAPAADAPVVVLNHGFSDSNIGPRQAFVQLGRELAGRGASVFAFDRLGHGISDGDFGDMTIGDEVDQLEAMIELAAASSASKAVHVVGYSLGAVESAIITARRPELVSTLTLWSPAGVIVDDIAGKNQIMGQDLAIMDAIGYFDCGGMALRRNLVDEVKGGIDVYGLAAGSTVPTLVVHGTADPIVPLDYGRRYAELLGDTATFVSIEGADHGWSFLPHRRQLFDRTLGRIGMTAGA